MFSDCGINYSLFIDYWSTNILTEHYHTLAKKYQRHRFLRIPFANGLHGVFGSHARQFVSFQKKNTLACLVIEWY